MCIRDRPRSYPWTDMHLIWHSRMVRRRNHCDKFYGDRLRGFDSVGVENCPFPLTKPVAVNTRLALPRSRWWHCVSILMYADDILLLAPSALSLQNLLRICENELLNLDMCLNVRKSICTRVGPRYKLKCSNLVTNDGREISWVDTVRYLGVFIVSSSRFCCSFDNAKKSFYWAFNAVFSKVGRVASQIVVNELLMSK